MSSLITHIMILDDSVVRFNTSIDEIMFFRQFYFKDDESRMFISDVSVDCVYRNNGLGNQILRLHHEYCRMNKFQYSLLWVDKDSWMEKWYMRNGYIFHEEKSETENWLIKEIF